jgi:hypothetical protein
LSTSARRDIKETSQATPGRRYARVHAHCCARWWNGNDAFILTGIQNDDGGGKGSREVDEC